MGRVPNLAAWQALSVLALTCCLGACGGAAPEPPLAAGPGAPAPAPAAPQTWALATATTGPAWSVGVERHADGSFAAAGGFYGTGLVGAGTPYETPVFGADASNAYVARVDARGNLLWVRTLTGLEFTDLRGVATAADGATYVCGFFFGTLIFEEGRPGEQAFEAQDEDGFLARYEADGTLAWVRVVGGAGIDELHGLAALSDGSVVASGLFEDTLTLGAGEAHETTRSPVGAMDALVACFEADGSLRWVRTVEAAPGDTVGGWDATALPGDEIVVCGDVGGSATFGRAEPAERTLTSVAGSSDAFLARYGADGTLRWVRTLGGPDSEYVARVSAAPDGSVRLTGVFAATATFGAGEPSETTLVSAGRHDGFVAHVAADGALVWVRQLAGPESDAFLEARVAADGTTLVAGTFIGAATVGQSEPGETTLLASDALDREIVVARYASDGSLLWAESLGGPGDDLAVGLQPLADGSFLLVGSFQDALLLDGVALLSGFFGEAGAFVVRLDEGGGY